MNSSDYTTGQRMTPIQMEIIRHKIHVAARKLKEGYTYTDKNGTITISRKTTDKEKAEFNFNEAMKILDE